MTIPDLSVTLQWLQQNPTLLTGIKRGIERETLRITPQGDLARTPFPSSIGSALTHRWITTDFAEAMLEFITPVSTHLSATFEFLEDLHLYATQQIGDELMWPMSMPCTLNHEDEITLAYYGTSHEGQVKTVYRHGLKNRYGAKMQTISGVHYNFSFPQPFWEALAKQESRLADSTFISEKYLAVIRNYYRFGWIIPYLFGASPKVCPSFLNDEAKKRWFDETGHFRYPYATSLRLSDIGYTSDAQKSLSVSLNGLEDYISGLRKGTQTVSETFAQLGLPKAGDYPQLNASVLQIENEFYAPIRPKRVPLPGEFASEALQRGGIEYIEVRSLDINPYSPIGITKEQAQFIDLFLIWCALAESPELSEQGLRCAKSNWQRIVLEGRRPGLVLDLECTQTNLPVSELGSHLMESLQSIAALLDATDPETNYQANCRLWQARFLNPDTVLSAQFLRDLEKSSIMTWGLQQAQQYKTMFEQKNYQQLTLEALTHEQQRSLAEQTQREKETTGSFETYLEQLNQKMQSLN